MLMINDNDYSNIYNKSNDNKNKSINKENKNATTNVCSNKDNN